MFNQNIITQSSSEMPDFSMKDFSKLLILNSAPFLKLPSVSQIYLHTINKQ